jgi:MFS family permease
MRDIDEAGGLARAPLSVPFFYGWFIVFLGFLSNLTAAGLRSAPSVLIHPLEAEFGWSRTQIASAASLNLLLLGLMAPFGGWLIDRYGPRRVILASLGTIAVGVSLTVFVSQLWQLIFLWGVILGIATGVTPPLGASIASRWFVSRRGLAIGIMTNANAAGQVIFLPVLMAVILVAGWRSALLMIATAAVILIPAIWLWMRDNPEDVGLQPFRSEKEGGSKPSRTVYARGAIRPIALSSVSEVVKTSTFWLLAGCFFICGVTANGLIGTHLIPHAIERGIPQLTAATAVGIMGGASFVGTTFAGWLVGSRRSAKSAGCSLRAARIVVVYLALRDRADGAICLRRDLRPGLVCVGAGDDDHHCSHFRPRASGQLVWVGFCVSPAGRRRRGHCRRVGAGSLRRLSVRFCDRRLHGFAGGLFGFNHPSAQPRGAWDPGNYRICQRVKSRIVDEVPRPPILLHQIDYDESRWRDCRPPCARSDARKCFLARPVPPQVDRHIQGQGRLL